MAPDILLIGTGITSAVSAMYLQKLLPAANIVLWDKARGLGGRMSRSISPSDSNCVADLGAQYITTSLATMEKYKDIYHLLLKENLIEGLSAKILGMKEFREDTRHFVAPQGMNSLVKYFLRDIPKEKIKFGSKVVAIDEDDGKFVVTSETDSCTADVIVATLPVPQFLQLSGSFKNYLKNEKALENVTYSSRFVLVLFYDGNAKFPKTDWACQYLDHDVFRYVAIDNVKRNRPDSPVAVIFHTSVKFGIENLEMTLPEMEVILMKQVRQLFPEWPEPSATKCHKWRFSQITNAFKDKPGFLLLKEKPTLVLGGDAFSESNFDGCVYSASKIAEAIHKIWHE